MRPFYILFFIVLQYCPFIQEKTMAQTASMSNDDSSKMSWFADAKLGIFIHAGIYSVNGVSESWSFHNKEVPYTAYMSQLKGFTLKNYDPNQWANLIAQTGAKYTVITTKHHDGVATYDTKLNDLSIVKATPAKKDLITPLFSELRKRNIKCGAYFSLIDWSHPDYPGFLKDSSRYIVAKDTAKWEKFQHFFQGQINELSTKFNPDLFWFDGDWEHSAIEWQSNKVRQGILSTNKNAIINGRLQGFGDYETPEQNFPVTRPKAKYWELCMTLNNNWGYRVSDTNWKTPYEVITIFTDIVSNGGNLLLDIGPKEDGTFPKEVHQTLKELGDWNKRNGEAIFNTLGGIGQGHFYGPTTLSKDSTILYLFLQGQINGNISLKGLQNKIKSISVVHNNKPLKYKVVGKISWSSIPGIVYIQVPTAVNDKYVTVLRVKLDGPVRMYLGTGGL
ncbi:MAG: alpha-L-fucosidase [Chitinophagia bacterium]|jgi:alpha-L-fucosidase